MANAPRDDNRIPVMIGVLDSDGSTLTPIQANPVNNAIKTGDGITGSDLTGDNALRDANYVTVLLAASETDGTTPVPLYADSNGNLLIDSS